MCITVVASKFRFINKITSVKEIANELLELLEADFTDTLWVHLLKCQLELLLVHVLRLAQELIQLFHRDALVLVNIDLPEDGLETLLSQELLLVDGDHHELIKGDKAIT